MAESAATTPGKVCSAIAELQGRPVPGAGPEAELWLGAHPGDLPAMVDTDGDRVSLVDLVAAEPGRWLGEQLVDRFGVRPPCRSRCSPRTRR